MLDAVGVLEVCTKTPTSLSSRKSFIIFLRLVACIDVLEEGLLVDRPALIDQVSIFQPIVLKRPSGRELLREAPGAVMLRKGGRSAGSNWIGDR